MPKKTEAATEPEALEPAYEPRRATEGMTVGYTKADGSQATIEADADGVMWPNSPEEVAVLDSFDLPVARKALSEFEAAAQKTADTAADVKPSEAPKE